MIGLVLAGLAGAGFEVTGGGGAGVAAAVGTGVAAAVRAGGAAVVAAGTAARGVTLRVATRVLTGAGLAAVVRVVRTVLAVDRFAVVVVA